MIVGYPSDLRPMALAAFDATAAQTEEATEQALYELQLKALMRVPLVGLYRMPRGRAVCWTLLARCASAIPAINVPCLPRSLWVPAPR